MRRSRTTYFDTLQDHRTESGESSDKLKITEVPELNRKKKGRKLQKKREYYNKDEGEGEVKGNAPTPSETNPPAGESQESEKKDEE